MRSPVRLRQWRVVRFGFHQTVLAIIAYGCLTSLNGNRPDRLPNRLQRHFERTCDVTRKPSSAIMLVSMPSRRPQPRAFTNASLAAKRAAKQSALRRRAPHVARSRSVNSLAAACSARDEVDGPRILAVTVLTSLDRADMEDLGFRTDVRELVLSRARRALEIGCDGVISSGLEAPALRRATRSGFLVVVPGIRPADHGASDDQKRTVDVEEAFERGADHIVVGRPIRGAADPRAAALAIQQRIVAYFDRA